MPGSLTRAIHIVKLCVKHYTSLLPGADGDVRELDLTTVRLRPMRRLPNSGSIDAPCSTIRQCLLQLQIVLGWWLQLIDRNKPRRWDHATV
jgi:hypothetical protein